MKNWISVVFAFFFINILHAQRNIDLDVKLVSPYNGQVIFPFTTIPVSVDITNNGPDTLILGDTIWYNTSLKPLFIYEFFIVGNELLPGSTALFHIDEIKNAQSSEFHDTTQFCVRVSDRSGVPGMGQGSFNDTIKSNNSSCAEIIIKSTYVKSILYAENIQLYPNPATNFLYIETSNTPKLLRYAILDLSGRNIQNGVLNNDHSNHTSIDVKNLHEGAYILKIISKNGDHKSAIFIKQ